MLSWLNPTLRFEEQFHQTISFSSYQFDSLLCSFFSAEGYKGVASVQATERIHHQAQVPDGASFLKQRNQLILKKVSGDFANKYLPG